MAVRRSSGKEFVDPGSVCAVAGELEEADAVARMAELTDEGRVEGPVFIPRRAEVQDGNRLR